MSRENCESPRATFPEKKKQNFQEKFAQLLKGEKLGDQNGMDFGFDHDFSDSNHDSTRRSQRSDVDSEQDLAYEEQIRDLKRRIMESKERKTRKFKKQKIEQQHEEIEEKWSREEHSQRHSNRPPRAGPRGDSFDTDDRDWNEQGPSEFDPDHLRLSRYQKVPGGREGLRTRKKAPLPETADDGPERRNVKQHRSHIHHKTHSKVKPKVASRSEYGRAQGSGGSKRHVGSFLKGPVPHVSSYKKNMIFEAHLKLKKIRFGSRKTGVLKFDIEYNNNFIPAKKNHEINGYQAGIKEAFKVPFRAIYDRRKRSFYCESVIVNVMNMHKRYNKRLGRVEVNVADTLNRQQIYFNGKLRLKKTNDRQAEMDIVLSLKFQGTSDEEQVTEPRSKYHFDDSYFSAQSER